MKKLRQPLSAIVGIVVAGGLGTAPVCVGQSTLPIARFEPPLQHYVVVDMSGTAATSFVEQVALNDAGQAAFGFLVNGGSEVAEFHVFTWDKGQLGPEWATDLVVEEPQEGGGFLIRRRSPHYLLPSGQASGMSNLGEAIHQSFSSYGGETGDFGIFSPPFLIDRGHRGIGDFIGDVASENGCRVGGGSGLLKADTPLGITFADFSFVRDPSGQLTLFNRTPGLEADYSLSGPLPGITSRSEYFLPNHVNNEGWAIGAPVDTGSYIEPNPTMLWNCQTLVSVGAGHPADINSQGQVLVRQVRSFFDPTPSLIEESYLWENGVRTVFRDMLPPYLQRQVRDVQAFSLSNQRKPLPAPMVTGADTTIHLLADAQIEEQSGKLVLRRDNAGKWSAAKVLLPAGTDITAWQSINASGVIAAMGTTRYLPGDPHALLLVPVDLAVDADRNGLVEFDQDTTSPERPFRFWINDDYDDEDGEGVGGIANYADRAINGTRDLEDFTQLKFRLPQLLTDLLKAGKARIGFKWKSYSPGSVLPAVRVWSGSPNLDRPDYLRSQAVASQVIGQNNLLPWQTTLMPVRDTLVVSSFPVWLRENLMGDAATNTVNLLMEGCYVGAAKLVLVVEVNGVESEGPGVDIKLLNVRQMYERGKVPEEASEVADPWLNRPPPTLSWVWDPWNWPPDADPSAEPQTIAYVHGWRMPYPEYLRWADTSFKRLWQLGYKGRFYSFRWPTYHGDNVGPIDPASIFDKPGGLTYNPSEYRAWLSGPALADFVNGLPNPNDRYLIAHSMGNVVSGSALRSGMQVTRYAMCNAAMAAMVYDASIQDDDFETPDTDPDMGTRQTFGLANKLNPISTDIVSFSLPKDSALGQWSFNNAHFKPQTFLDATYYDYDPVLYPVGSRLRYEGLTFTKAVTSLPEAMAYVTQSRSRAAGAKQATRGSIARTVNMGEGGFEFGEEHSAEWIYSIQRTYPFWRRVAEEFNVDLLNR